MTVPSPSPSPSASDRSGDDNTADRATTVHLAVEGMHCGSCVALIEESLAEQVGVVSAEVDLDTARAVIGYDPLLLTVDDLRSTITEAGYAATPVG